MNSIVALVRFVLAMVTLIPSTSKADDNNPPAPCAVSERRQFDFWIGEWDVEDTTGRHIGRNTVAPILGGCVLQENWKGDGGMSGTSLNTYDASTKQWHQTWMDDKGGCLRLDGEFRDGRMILQGRRKPRAGGSRIDRITWTKINDDQVRQFWDVSKDDGETWAVAFDGIYKRRKK